MKRFVFLLGMLWLSALVPATAQEGRELYAAHCAVCHGERFPRGAGMRPRYRPLHRALGLSDAEDAAVRAWLSGQHRRARAAPAPVLANPPEKETLARGDRPPLPPRWVFEPWKWRNEHAGPAEVWEDVEAMERHGIPCGALIIDSPWSAGYGSHRFWARRWRQDDEAVSGTRLVRELQARGLKVLLWTTCVVNDGSRSKPPWDLDGERALWEEGDARGLFHTNPVWRLTLGLGLESHRIRWWKGVGSHIDLARPAGCTWWYELLDRALVDLGVDGFKVDGGWPPLTDEYYFQTSAHTARRTAGRGVTISRPRGGNLRSALACWTGDEEPDWNGMQLAMLRLSLASQAGYSTVGSDIGGFGGSPPEAVLLRWAQLGCFSGVMELGGGGVHEPWAFGPRCVELYRYYATLRSELVPYLHSAAHEANQGGTPLMRWSRAEAFAFRCGPEVYVAPLSNDAGTRRVRLPRGARWREWFDPAQAHPGGSELEVHHPDLASFPLYVREGAVLPLERSTTVVGHAAPPIPTALTLLCFPGTEGSWERPFWWGERPGVAPTDIRMDADATALRLELSGRPLAYPELVVELVGRTLGKAEAHYGDARLPLTRGADPTALRETKRVVAVDAGRRRSVARLPLRHRGRPLSALVFSP